LLDTDELLEETGIASTRETLLGYLLQKFKEESLKSLEEGILLDIFEIYTQFVSFFPKIFLESDFVEIEYRSAICQFIDEQLIPRVYYK
jgi:hypothetical protein